MNGELLVCFAVEQEAAPFRKKCAHSPHVRVLVTGMGRRNAERVSGSLNDVARVITAGFAGALDPALNVGDVLFQSEDAGMREELAKAGAREATFHCSETIAVTAAAKAALNASSKAHAVEMESGVIREICRARTIPCTTVRAISDLAAEDLPLDFNRLLNANDALSPWKLAGAIVASPQKIPALIRLGKNSTLAANRLADVLCRIV